MAVRAAHIKPVEAYCIEITSPDGFRWLALIQSPARQRKQAIARRLNDRGWTERDLMPLTLRRVTTAKP